jgi:hypothetical protein
MKLNSVVILILFSVSAFAQQGFAPDKVSDILTESKEGSHVSVKGEIVSSVNDDILELSDGSGIIKLNISLLEDKNLEKGDHLTLNGKVKISENGEKSITATYFRKHEYVKDPSRCCMPEF